MLVERDEHVHLHVRIEEVSDVHSIMRISIRHDHEIGHEVVVIGVVVIIIIVFGQIM
jgi:hypothetical protein